MEEGREGRGWWLGGGCEGGCDAGCLRAGPARQQSLAAGEGEGRCEKKGEEGAVGKTMTVEGERSIGGDQIERGASPDRNMTGGIRTGRGSIL